MEAKVLNTSFEQVFVVDVFHSLIWTDKYFEAGSVELYISADSKYFIYLQEDNYLSIKESDRTMVIESIELKTNIEEGDKFIVKGHSLESILQRRIIWNQTSISGNFQDGIQRLLNENVISPTDPDRKISNFTFEATTDSNIIDLTIDEQFWGDNLYDVISKLCLSKNVGFKVTIGSSNTFVFKLYFGVDRSYNQIVNPFVSFSPDLDNIKNTNYFHSKLPHKTIALIAGEGSGSDRLTTHTYLSSGPGLNLDRRELFVDAGEISTMVDGVVISPEEYYTLLITAGLYSLLENQQVSFFDGDADLNTNYEYGVDVKLGDIVQTENEYGITGRSRITEMVFSENLSGINTYPTFDILD